MANVIWQNGTWTYGNWGGKGWSGGKFSLPNEKPNESIRGIDKLDEIFKSHDLAYYDIQTAYNASAKTTADQVKYWQSIIEADTTMRSSISALQFNGGLTDMGAKAAADQANSAFAAKDAYNHLQLNAATVGGIQGDPYTGMPWPGSDNSEFAADYVDVIVITAKRDPALYTPTDAATRISSNYITDTSANDHLVQIKSWRHRVGCFCLTTKLSQRL